MLHRFDKRFHKIMCGKTHSKVLVTVGSEEFYSTGLGVIQTHKCSPHHPLQVKCSLKNVEFSSAPPQLH